MESRFNRMIAIGSSIYPLFFDRFISGNNILGPCVRLKVHGWGKHKSSPWRQDLQPLADMANNFLRGEDRGATIWVSTPPPQNVKSLPNSLFSSAGSMPRAERPYRIERINTNFDKIRDKFSDRSVTVHENVPVRMLFNVCENRLVPRLNQFTIHPGRNRGDYFGLRGHRP